ncbi:FecR family protein [Asticcacaulis sp.]|uniref:FecR family protein n=1 Tax=Asticcacaulis sp. TaxID=1872648 RepID=UPI002C9D04E0|nr:DUF4880 domain-containing protein [Asticcacaulis sp.]HTM81563.1 DUF4880 domain-containing protein [Asticcacaulis sp.]
MISDNNISLDALMEQAARWHARMDCGTADHEDFEAWRSADPRNAAAFARIIGTADQVHHLKPFLKRSVESPSRRGFFQAAVAASAAVAFGGGAIAIMRGKRVNAETPIGDHQSRTLPDGGRIDLNTDSKVEWRFDKDERSVWLKRGEVAVSIPEDPRPFCLYANGQKVIATAGRINARLRNSALDLLVLDGKFAVAPIKGQGGAKKASIIVTTGNAVLAGASTMRMRSMTPDDVQFVSAWQDGELYFNGETLGAAVEEYNRYLPKKISIGDPSLQGIRLGGRFSSRDPADFIASLHDAFAIAANRTEDGSIILTR